MSSLNGPILQPVVAVVKPASVNTPVVTPFTLLYSSKTITTPEVCCSLRELSLLIDALW